MSCLCNPLKATAASVNALRSSIVSERVFGRPVTITRSEAPIAAAIADAETALYAGSADASAARKSSIDASVDT
jgi:hypothetical protein